MHATSWCDNHLGRRINQEYPIYYCPTYDSTTTRYIILHSLKNIFDKQLQINSRVVIFITQTREVS